MRTRSLRSVIPSRTGSFARGEEQVIVLYHPSTRLICSGMAGRTIDDFSIVLLPVPGRRFAARRYHAEQSRKRSPDFIPGAVVSLGGGSKPPPLHGLITSTNTPWAARPGRGGHERRVKSRGTPGVHGRENYGQFLKRLFNRSKNRLQQILARRTLTTHRGLSVSGG